MIHSIWRLNEIGMLVLVVVAVVAIVVAVVVVVNLSFWVHANSLFK